MEKRDRRFAVFVATGVFLFTFCFGGMRVCASETGIGAGSDEAAANGQYVPEAAASETAGPGQMMLGAVAVGGMQAEGTKLKVCTAVQVLPDASGVDHVNIQFRNRANDRSVTKILRDRDFVDGVYVGWLELSIYEPEGVFELDKVILQNRDGAYVKYCRPEDLGEQERYVALPVTAAFQVGNGVGVLDETPPVLEAVSVSPIQAPKESEIQVLVAVSDDFSGVESVTVRFENENEKAVSAEAKWNGELYVATIRKSLTKEPGVYRIKRVTVTDHMGNSRVYRGGDGPFASDVFYIIY